jgi:ABC-type sugar transport system substrate-binding protein
VTAKFSLTPKTLNLTTPLSKAPAKGKTFVNLECGLSQCATITIGIKDAAQAVGWNVKTLTYDDANPGTLVTAMKQALQYNPVAVSVTGLPEAVWGSLIPAYKKAGVPIVVGSVGPIATTFPVIANIQGPPDMQQQADALAAQFISSSGAKGNALLLNVPGFPILNEFSQDFKRDVAAECPACHVSELDASVAQAEANSLPQTVASALRRDPSAKFFVACDSAFIAGIPAALSSAGLSDVKVSAMWGNSATEALVKNGQMATVTTQASLLLGALLVDPAMRYAEKATIPAPSQYVLPIKLLTKANASTWTPADTNDYPTNWLAQLKNLWKVS